MMAVFILTFGLLAAGQTLFTAAGLTHLARSKNTALIAAQNTLEYLSDLYRQDPEAPEFTLGNHGPVRNKVYNPVTGGLLHQYDISWISEAVPDAPEEEPPRGLILKVRATPLSASEQTVPHQLPAKTLTLTSLVGASIPGTY